MYKGCGCYKNGLSSFWRWGGDYIALFVDGTIASTLGMNLPPYKNAKSHMLKLQDPRLIKKYNKCLNHFFKRHFLSDQTKLLQARVSCPITSEHAKEYERLDKLRIVGMQYAEKQCRKLKKGRDTMDTGAHSNKSEH